MKIIEEKAEKILSQIGINAAPVDVSNIAKRANILIKHAPSKEFSGLLYRKDNTAYMAISSSESDVRQRFTIAHELGHFYLHPQKDTFVEYRDNEKNIVRGYKEVQANQFAAALLIPRKLLEKDVKSLNETEITKKTLDFLAKKYQVSDEAMTYRLINLNLLSNK